MHLVCSFFFDTILYETLFSSDLDLVSFCCFGVWGFVFLFCFVFFLFLPDFSLNVNMLALFPPLPPLTCYICPDILTSLYLLGKVPEIIHQCSSLMPRFLRYSFVLYHSNSLLEVLRKSGVQNALCHVVVLM